MHDKIEGIPSALSHTNQHDMENFLRQYAWSFREEALNNPGKTWFEGRFNGEAYENYAIQVLYQNLAARCDFFLRRNPALAVPKPVGDDEAFDRDHEGHIIYRDQDLIRAKFDAIMGIGDTIHIVEAYHSANNLEGLRERLVRRYLLAQELFPHHRINTVLVNPFRVASNLHLPFVHEIHVTMPKELLHQVYQINQPNRHGVDEVGNIPDYTAVGYRRLEREVLETILKGARAELNPGILEDKFGKRLLLIKRLRLGKIEAGDKEAIMGMAYHINKTEWLKGAAQNTNAIYASFTFNPGEPIGKTLLFLPQGRPTKKNPALRYKNEVLREMEGTTLAFKENLSEPCPRLSPELLNDVWWWIDEVRIPLAY